MPSEKYSPFLLVFRLYFRPLSVLLHSRLAPTIGFPCASLQTPFTVPVAWANTGGTHSAATATATTSTTISKRCFMFWPPGSQNSLKWMSQRRLLGRRDLKLSLPAPHKEL